MPRTTVPLMVAFLIAAGAVARGESPAEKLDDLLDKLQSDGLIHTPIGVTRKGTPIRAVITADDLDHHSTKTRILIVGGLGGSPKSVDAALATLKWFYESPKARPWREHYTISAVPCANPDGWAALAGPGNTSGGNPTMGYPPKGDAYNSPTDPEAAYLWRWIGMHGPDLVVVLQPGPFPHWGYAVPDGAKEPLVQLAEALWRNATQVGAKQAGDLVSALVTGTPANVGSVPAVSASVPIVAGEPFLPRLLGAVKESQFRGPSPARRQLQQRLDRTPLKLAEQLAAHYGHRLPQATYIPAVALIGRLRLGELTGDPKQRDGVEQIVAEYADGTKAALPQRPSGSHFSGHLIFSELAKATGKAVYTELARKAADLGFDAQGSPREAMPEHLEMSDSVFMGGPILAQVGRLTGEQKYFDMCVRHVRFMIALNVRNDGLHRHSPLDESAWGRGNGFPALGLALCLDDLPEAHPGRREMLEALRDHLTAMVRHQDPTGAWHQVVDHPESYRELTSTCMITFAMVRGVRRGWLDEKIYKPMIEKAWCAIRTRVAPDGTLVDVCTGTGKQKSLQDYLDRKAILGADGRGGAMALLAATEIAAWQKEREARSTVR